MSAHPELNRVAWFPTKASAAQSAGRRSVFQRWRYPFGVPMLVLLALSMLITLIMAAPTPAKAAAFTNDYPDMDAVDCSAKYGMYSWCKAGTDLSSRGYDYRNCVDGVSYWVNEYLGINPSGWGDANNWDDAATNYTVYKGNTNRIEPGDIAQSDDGTMGHVAFIIGVNKHADGTVASFTTAEMNAAGKGEYSSATYTTRNSSGNFVRYGAKDWDHFIDVNGSGKGLMNETLSTVDPHEGTVTLGSFNPASATFYLRNSNTAGNPDTVAQYGAGGWQPITGDWDGNGSDTLGSFDPSTATFYLRNSASPGSPDIIIQFGAKGWLPIVGDWDGNGTTTIGAFNPDTATFYLRNSNSPGNPDAVIQFGAGGWKPVAGDWDGNGTATIGVFDPGAATFYLRNHNSPGNPDTVAQYGAGDWFPVVGDWDGNGTSTIGVFDPSTATFYLRNKNTAGNPDFIAQYGAGGWLPIVGNWDGR